MRSVDFEGGISKGLAIHARWKHGLKQAILDGDGEALPSFECATESCPFTAWLDQVPDAYRCGSFSSVIAHHQAFHDQARKACYEYRAHGQDAAIRFLQQDNGYTAACVDLVSAIANWQGSLRELA